MCLLLLAGLAPLLALSCATPPPAYSQVGERVQRVDLSYVLRRRDPHPDRPGPEMKLEVWSARGEPASESFFGPWTGPWEDMAVLELSESCSGKIDGVTVLVKQGGRWSMLGRGRTLGPALPWSAIRFVDELPIVTMPDGALVLPEPKGTVRADAVRVDGPPRVTRVSRDAWWVSAEGAAGAAEERRVIRRRRFGGYAVALTDVREHAPRRAFTGRSTEEAGPANPRVPAGRWAIFAPTAGAEFRVHPPLLLEASVTERPEAVAHGGEVLAWLVRREGRAAADLVFVKDPSIVLLADVEEVEAADLRTLVPALAGEKEPVHAILARAGGAPGWSLYRPVWSAFASGKAADLLPCLHAAPAGGAGTLADARAAAPAAWAAYDAQVKAARARREEADAQAAAEEERRRLARVEERRKLIAQNEREGRPCLVVGEAVEVSRPTSPAQLPARSLVHAGGAWHMAIRRGDEVLAWPIRYDGEARKGAITGGMARLKLDAGPVPAIVGASAYAAVEKVVGTPKVVAVECAACVGTGIEAYAVDTVDQFGGTKRGVYFKFGEHTGGMGRLFELPEWNVQKEAGTAKPWYAALAASGAAVIEVGARSEHRGQVVYPLPCPSCRGAGAFER